MRSKWNFNWVFPVLVGYCMIILVVFVKITGIYFPGSTFEENFIDLKNYVLQEPPARNADTLLLIDYENKELEGDVAEWREIFSGMDVAYQEASAEDESLDFSKYSKVVITFPDLSKMLTRIDGLMEWVDNGGGLLLAATLASGAGTGMISQQIGIVSSDYNAILTSEIIPDEFFLGGDVVYSLDNPYKSSNPVILSDDCIVHITDGSRYKNPLLWERKSGNGNYIVSNLGFNTEETRGIYAVAFSLLGDAFVYPVINSSTFYIDDFPSPVPEGRNEYIWVDYQRDVSGFYTNIWWPDLIRLMHTYGIRYTGVTIETYNDNTNPPLESNTDIDRHSYFGNSLLLANGEIGLHGYNHEPLVLKSFDYMGEEDYKKWPDEEAIKDSLLELDRFFKQVFPQTPYRVYVPPSNILSAEGRELLVDTLPDVKAIASLYFYSKVGYQQKFEVAEDGIVEMPRIVSGMELTPYMKLAAFSELNFHYVQSHFTHPDDLLDIERGAEFGWDYMRDRFEEYLQYLEKAAPDIRQHTASEEAGAIQRFYFADVMHTVTDQQISIDITNLYDQVFCFVRINEGSPGKISGGKLEHLTGNLYLLTATDAHVTIDRQD